jgi:hypothetical protein
MLIIKISNQNLSLVSYWLEKHKITQWQEKYLAKLISNISLKDQHDAIHCVIRHMDSSVVINHFMIKLSHHKQANCVHCMTVRSSKGLWNFFFLGIKVFGIVVKRGLTGFFFCLWCVCQHWPVGFSTSMQVVDVDICNSNLSCFGRIDRWTVVTPLAASWTKYGHIMRGPSRPVYRPEPEPMCTSNH